MNISKGYIGLLFYDIPMENSKMRKEYQIFRKAIIKIGYYQIQESVYACKINYKATRDSQIKELKMIAPIGANIRFLFLTKLQYKNMFLISGEATFNENILLKDNFILEL